MLTILILIIAVVNATNCPAGSVTAVPADGAMSDVNYAEITGGASTVVACNPSHYVGNVTIKCDNSNGSATVLTHTCVKFCPAGTHTAVPNDGNLSNITYGQLNDGTSTVETCASDYTGSVTVVCNNGINSFTNTCVRKVCPAAFINDGNNNWLAHNNLNSGASSTLNCPTGSTGSLSIMCSYPTVSVTSGGCTASGLCPAGCIDASDSLACWSGTLTNGSSALAICDGNYVGTVTVSCNNSIISKTGACVAAKTISGSITNLIGDIKLNLNIGNVEQTITDLNTFTFSDVACCQAYSVTVAEQPVNQSCTIANGAGSHLNSDINNIQIDCVSFTTTAIETTHESESSEAEDSGPAILACIVLMIITATACCGTFWYFYNHKELANAVTRRMNANKNKNHNKLNDEDYDEEYNVDVDEYADHNRI